ncbi:hypothetical protein VRRI112168_02455 [Vreelandella rituensis]|uniref:Uncharacterized protein n=1 Tax=Vreelandella rituensis TaxID=2282306 RepID=A0A368U9I4_9GAMM|nr:hypothetical protein [Halomonas rituensis]RCV93605.1 hypothetical protein DU506_00175 [Halomonas rituensis]
MLNDMTDREFDTILAALRLFQATPTENMPDAILAIAQDSGASMLDDDEIDALCERLNTEDTSSLPPEVRATAALGLIHAILDGSPDEEPVEWDSETLSEVANVVTDHGYVIRQPGDEEE